MVSGPAARERGGIDWSAVGALVRRDLRAVRRSKAVVLPMVFVPVVLLVLLPASVGMAANGKTIDVSRFLEVLPRSLVDAILEVPPDERLVVLVLGYLVGRLAARRGEGPVPTS